MKKESIALLVVLIVIASAIVLLEKSKGPAGVPSAVVDQVVKRGLAGERAEAKAKLYPAVKELVSPDGYINTDYVNISDNIGKKVILVDFWTYSCINCQRTLPYLNAWQEKYADEGLLIIGVHTPEFEFEKKYGNVLAATEKYGVKYPIVLDNGYQTWRAYGNRYWPRKYLIDIDGYIVYDHIGEGGYAETEKKIQELLSERAEVLKLEGDVQGGVAKPDAADVDFSRIGTPEIYLGYDFSRDQFGNPEGLKPGEVVDYVLPAEQEPSRFYLSGRWKNNQDSMESAGDSVLVLQYSAKKANIVAGADRETPIDVTLDGEDKGTVLVSSSDLYNVASMDEYGTHKLELKVPAGVQVYTFTFG